MSIDTRYLRNLLVPRELWQTYLNHTLLAVQFDVQLQRLVSEMHEETGCADVVTAQRDALINCILGLVTENDHLRSQCIELLNAKPIILTDICGKLDDAGGACILRKGHDGPCPGTLPEMR